MLKLNLILQIMNQIDHYQKEKINYVEDELAGKNMAEFVGLRAKTYSYLIDDCKEDKNAKNTKKCVIKRKIKFENYKNCLEAT